MRLLKLSRSIDISFLHLGFHSAHWLSAFVGCFQVGVVLNLTPDHLERHGNMEEYGAAKCALFQHMGTSQIAAIPQGKPLTSSVVFEIKVSERYH